MNRDVKVQLTAFAILTIIGLVTMSVVYLRVPTALGWDRTNLTLEMPDTGGLYSNANVSYLGTVIGQVDSVVLQPGGVRADMHVKSSADIPENVRAEVRSVSAVGEQYVDLIPEGAPSGKLADGTTLGEDKVSMPQGIGPVLDQAGALVASIDDQKMRRVISEAFTAFQGTDRDLQNLLDSTRLFLQEAQANSEVTNKLIVDAEPLLDSQLQSSDAIRAWTKNLANVTEQLRTNEPQLTSITNRAPDTLDKVTNTLNELQPTLPVLVANLMSIGEVGVVYNRSIEQILVLYPALVSGLLSSINRGRDAGAIQVDFNLQVNKTPPCTTGFIPAADRRGPGDLSVPAQVNGLYCRVPSDSSMTVRGARNFPCMEFPGRRGANPEQCRAGGYSDADVLGSNPPDPSEIGPPNTTIGPNKPDDLPKPPPTKRADYSAYSAPVGDKVDTSAAVYDSKTGEYVASDGRTYRQADLVQGTKVPAGASMTDVMTNGVATK